MTILSAQTIRRYCNLFKMVEPFHERTVVNGSTFGLSSAGYDVRLDLPTWDEDRTVLFMPRGDFRLASTLEHFKMPNNVMGIVHDKSSWARKGVTVQNTVIEPGWRGHLTLELTNHGSKSAVVRHGDAIAQIVFHFLDDVTCQPYDGKYQDQARGPQEAIDETG